MPASSRPAEARLDRAARRWSLRLRVVGAILLVALAPQLLVFVWSQIDRPVQGRLWGRVRDASDDADAALTRVPVAEAAEALARVARTRGVRLRVLDASGRPLVDVDADSPGEPFNGVEAFFFGTPTDTLGDVDDQEGPLELRPGVGEARRTGRYIACQWISIGYCESIRSGRDKAGERLLVYVQATSRRAVSSVYELRRQLLKLGLFTVPFALLLAIYLGGRLVRPIETLQRQALAHAKAVGPGVALDPETRDEVSALADAFNTLLQALETKRAENEAFVADLVHELKNPVAAVRVVADTLTTGGLDPERAERVARVLRDSSTKLDRVVSQFLEIARADAGLPDEERAVEDVARLVGAQVKALQEDDRHPDVTFAFTCAAPDEARVLGVADRLEALFLELLENARSFAGAGGRVDVRIDRDGGEVVVVVSDTGPGIAPEDLARVFTRFFTTRGRARGTGLGLALVQAVAHAHGGTVSVRSSPGAGASFEVRLPRA
ncbi:MAG: HAMP domain-containing sensor histidine kinase [Polyangiaceae bacterium]